MNITVDLIMSWRPCDDLPRERVEAMFAGRESVTPIEVARCEDVPAEDRVWLLLHEPVFTPKQLRLFACTFAERALMRERAAGREPDPRSWAAIEVSRRYARGEATDGELASAMAAAWAAWAAARDDARAAWDAWDAAWAAEFVEQLRIITEALVET